MDGQVLVLHDLLGVSAAFRPKFVRTWMDGSTMIRQAIQSYHVDVTVEGNCIVDNRASTVDALPHTLKSLGADSESRIEIVVPSRSAASLVQISRSLSEAGYRKIHFTRPRRATAYVAP